MRGPHRSALIQVGARRIRSVTAARSVRSVHVVGRAADAGFFSVSSANRTAVSVRQWTTADAVDHCRQ
ncbi:hypothetical protein GCM10010238_19370 [Streptomyces griseoviridis]|uniref:Uncharacterized protein n=1 Tax=Streptomyces griseoviridis TaxID=45398 RepID=A0A918GE54_STRGD|nr:hypothetical protein GCM10010238_19370 [Streptomyces niveoruber]